MQLINLEKLEEKLSKSKIIMDRSINDIKLNPLHTLPKQLKNNGFAGGDRARTTMSSRKYSR